MILGKRQGDIKGKASEKLGFSFSDIMERERYRKTEGFPMNKKGAELSINTLIIIILAIIVLVTMIFIFSSAARQFAAAIFTWLKNSLGMLNETPIAPLPKP